MAKIKIDGKPAETIGSLPDLNSISPDITLANTEFSDISLESFKGKRIILNIFPSIDLPVCAATVRKFN